METIAKLPNTEIDTFSLPSREAFVPLLTARKSQIAQTPKKTFKYGCTDRHQIDVYYPPSGTSNAPLLFFFYGGRFIAGSRSLVAELLYDNLGAFFAQRGILIAIADYRLAPGTKYPGPAYDARDAIRFALLSPDVNVTGHGANKTCTYLMGHSAGGAHISTLLLNEGILEDHERSAIKGAIFNSAAFGSNFPNFTTYYGEPEEEIARKCPLGLLKSKSADKVKELSPPRLFILSPENDVRVLMEWSEALKEVLREKGITDFKADTIKGHNHVSPNLALYSGEGEEWGEEVARWIKA